MMDEMFTSDVSKEEKGDDDDDDDDDDGGGGKSEPPATFLSALDGIDTKETAHEVLCQ
jgi:hypothetical protein